MLTSVKRYIARQQFEAGIVGLIVNPFYFARKGLYCGIKNFAPNITGKVLDVGCGRKPYEHLFHVEQYIGLEQDRGEKKLSDKADVYYDGSRIPFADQAFDSIISNEVLEHVFTPLGFFKELNRVLKLNGMLLLSAPFIWVEHMQPYDFARYSSFALQSLLHDHGFEIVQHKKSINDIRVLFQLLNSYIYKKTETRSGVINLIVCALLMGPVNILGEVVSLVIPKNDEMYLDNIILARKIKNV